LNRVLAVLVAALCLAAVAPASASAAKTPKDFYGVTTQNTLGVTDGFLLNGAHVGTLRFQLQWGTVQHEPGRCQATAETGICDWRDLDAGMGLLAAFQVRPFPYLLNVPAFIDPDPNTPPIRSKSDARLWTGFLDALVRRYGQGGIYWRKFFPQQFPDSKPLPITQWEVWNEPSDGSYWHPKPDPEEYAKLLEISGRAIHNANEKADVVFAGLFGTPTEDNNGIKAFNYYRRAFARKGLKRHFDAVGVHPYGPTLARVKTQMGWVLDEMKTAGLENRDIWVTEIAWSSSDPPTILGVGPEGQAAMLTQAFKLFRSMRSRWNIAGVHWYAWQDLPPGFPLCEFCEKAGLVDYDRNPKPSYYAFQAAAG
jgi:hypothetical protein